MARPRMPDGKRVPLSTRTTEARAAELDEARGDMSVSEALDTALGYWLAARRRALRKTAPGGNGAPVAARDTPERDAAREVPFSSAERQ